jgi:hypothetical protein
LVLVVPVEHYLVVPEPAARVMELQAVIHLLIA